MMVAAFSHSNAVGKLPLHLPDVPKGVRFDFPRYSPVEASSALQYYHRYGLSSYSDSLLYNSIMFYDSLIFVLIVQSEIDSRGARRLGKNQALLSHRRKWERN